MKKIEVTNEFFVKYHGIVFKYVGIITGENSKKLQWGYFKVLNWFGM